MMVVNKHSHVSYIHCYWLKVSCTLWQVGTCLIEIIVSVWSLEDMYTIDYLAIDCLEFLACCMFNGRVYQSPSMNIFCRAHKLISSYLTRVEMYASLDRVAHAVLTFSVMVICVLSCMLCCFYADFRKCF